MGLIFGVRRFIAALDGGVAAFHEPKITSANSHVPHLERTSLNGIGVPFYTRAPSVLGAQRPGSALDFLDSTRVVLAALLLFSAPSTYAEELQQSALVGRSVTYDEVVLEGPELKPKPIDDNTAVVVRIKEVYPHGSAFRYSFDVYGLEPGTFNVLDFLQRSDGSEVADFRLSPCKCSRRYAMDRSNPSRLTIGRSPWLGGYRLALLLGGLAWIVGLIWLVRLGRKPATDEAHQDQPTDHYGRPAASVGSRCAGRQTRQRSARDARAIASGALARATCADEMEPLEALSALREHEEAGQLLRSLEDWLHRPDPPQEVDVEALLRPYADVESPVRRATKQRVDHRPRRRSRHDTLTAGTDVRSSTAAAVVDRAVSAAGVRLDALGRETALPFDHGSQREGKWLARLVNIGESLPALLLAVVVIILAGPQHLGLPEQRRALTNIEFCVDVSGSMTASFGEGTRYDASLKAIDEFISYREGDAFGLTFFSDNVIKWVPLTNDSTAFACALPFMDPRESQPAARDGRRNDDRQSARLLPPRALAPRRRGSHDHLGFRWPELRFGSRQRFADRQTMPARWHCRLRHSHLQ